MINRLKVAPFMIVLMAASAMGQSAKTVPQYTGGGSVTNLQSSPITTGTIASGLGSGNTVILPSITNSTSSSSSLPYVSGAPSNQAAHLFWDTEAVAQWMHPITGEAENLPSGGHILLSVGGPYSTYNQAYMGLYYAGNSSTSNYGTLGLFSQNDILIWTPAGTVGIGTTSPGGRLDVEGSIVQGTTAASTMPTPTNVVLSYNATSTPTTGWNVVGAQAANPNTDSNNLYYGYVGSPAVTSSDSTSRILVGGQFSPSLAASGASSANYIYGLVGNGFLGSSSTTAGYTSLYGGSFSAGVAPTVPATTAVANVIATRVTPLVQSGSVTAVDGVEVTPQFGSTSGPANLVIPTYFGLQLVKPVYANGATITNNIAISQEDSAARNYFAGSVGIGTATPKQSLEVNGTTQFDGALVGPLVGSTNAPVSIGSAGIAFGGVTQTQAWTGVLCGGDYAESVDVTGDRTDYTPGDVLVIDSNMPGKFVKSAEPYSTLVTGVYSTDPGVLGRRQKAPKSADEVPMAMIGIVPTRVSAENGAIRPGDLLVTSSTFGHAMKGTDRERMLGAVIGKALGALESGTGVIEVAVTLQ